MKNKMLEIINHYGIMKQLKYFQSEVFELNESMIDYKYFEAFKGSPAEQYQRENIAGEIADVMVMLRQFQYYYGITNQEIEDIMNFKVERQLGRIEDENNNENRRDGC